MCILPFNGGILVSIMTMDTILKKNEGLDTVFSLGIDLSQTVASQCSFQPIPYRVPRVSYEILNEIYDMEDNLFLVSSHEDQYLYSYMTLHATKIPSGVLFRKGTLSEGIHLNYVIVNFKRLNMRTL